MEEIQRYRDAKGRFDSAAALIADYGQRFTRIGRQLSENPLRTVSPTPAQYPMDVVRAATLITPDDIPTFPEIEQALQEYYNARESLTRALSALSREDREFLKIA